MGYARIRPEIQEARHNPWHGKGIELYDLEGNELYWKPENEWVKTVCFDAQTSGLYVLTEDDDYYFTCHSIHLEYADTIPTEKKERPMGKHALPYNPLRDIEKADYDVFVAGLGQDLDTWQMIARDLARDILRGRADNLDAKEFAYDIINRLSHMPEMNIHPSERAR